MDRPKKLTYDEYGWQYKGHNYESDHDRALMSYTHDLELYCNQLEIQAVEGCNYPTCMTKQIKEDKFRAPKIRLDKPLKSSPFKKVGG